ncbi:MAG: class I SAM-dependent methyltransferase [Alphaproteobacteria bacterium]|nr:class I SAM-dependent methyltransferase [Alphaproteobacteria bacterium]
MGASRYVSAKLRHDPVHHDVLDIAESSGFGDVLDIGCGRGQMGVALLEARFARSVLGLDRSATHLDQARRAAEGLAFTTRIQDFALDAELPSADTVLIVDVLYQLAPAAQIALLRSAALAARRLVLLRTLDPERGVRSTITVAFERAARRISPHSGTHVSPLPIDCLGDILRQAGFAVSTTPCWRGTPTANVLLTARLRAQPAAA